MTDTKYQQELEEAYQKFGPRSRCREADNPDKCHRFFYAPLDTRSWPYLVLCEDQSDSSLTWHMACNEFDFKDLLTPEAEMKVSATRNRVLQFMEIYSRPGMRSYLLGRS